MKHSPIKALPALSLGRRYAVFMALAGASVVLICAFIAWHIYQRESNSMAGTLRRDGEKLEILLQDGLEQTRGLMEDAAVYIARSVTSGQELRGLYDFLTGAAPAAPAFSGAPVFVNNLFPWEYMIWYDHRNGGILETSNVGATSFPPESIGELVAGASVAPSRLHVGEVIYGATGNRWTLPVALAVASPEGRPLGVLIAGLGIDGIAGILERQLYSPHTQFLLLDKDLFIMAQFRARGLEPFNKRIVADVARRDTGRGTLEGSIAPSAWSPFPAVHYARMKRFPFIIVTGTDEDALAASVKQPILTAMAGVLAAGGLLLVLMAAFRRRIVEPIAQLSAAAAEISAGGYPKTFPAAESYEIEILSRQLRNIAEYSKELQESRKELQASHDLVRSALRYIAHELKTPLTQIMGFSEMMRQGACGTLTPKQQEYVGIVHEAALMQHTLIGSFLEQIREHEQGAAPLVKAQCDLKKITERYVGVFAAGAADKGLSISVVADPKLPELHADEGKIGNVVLNLVSNAIKYNNEGGKVTFRITSSRDGKYVKLSCEDTGIGIEKEHIQRIFSPFARVRNERTKHIDGTGLGLSYVKRIIGQHKGYITVHSKVGKGTRFTCYIPAKKEPAQEAQAAPPGMAPERKKAAVRQAART